MTGECDWYVVLTQPRREHMAAEHLARQGFAAYVPCYARTRRHARKIETIAAPLFPRYVFVSFDVADPAWRAVRSTRGVIDLVRSGLAPAHVPAWVVEGLRSRERADGMIEIGDQLALKPGDTIRITDGPFREQTALFDRLDDDGRVLALLSILGKDVSVPIALANVDVAS